MQVGRLLADELEVDLEGAVAHLRIDLADPHAERAAADVGAGDLPFGDAAEIEFVDLGAQLVAAGAVHLAETLAAVERLANLDREGSELAANRRAQVERVEAGAGERKAGVQRARRFAQLGELAGLQPLVGRLLAAQDSAALAVGLIGIAAVHELPARDEAALAERRLELVLATRGLGGEVRLDQGASLAGRV
jgi:hypothetical protein